MSIVTFIPGDGIGPEITAAVKKIFSAAHADIRWETVEAGIDDFNKTGKLIPDELIVSLKKNKIALKGPTTTPIGTGHRSINVAIRQQFKLFANVRPVLSIKGLKSYYEKIDLIVVRENSEGLYMGLEYKVGEDAAHTVKLITRQATEKIAHYCFQLARKLNRKKVSIVHKANIMKLTDGLFLEAARNIARLYPEITCNDLIIDNCCMQLVMNPQQFDMILTENFYGDILSDLAAGLVGGLGVAAGANIGDDMAVFEAVHGSAPDIAGKNLANPTALLLSATMMLDHLNQKSCSEKIRAALLKCLSSEDLKTRDLGGKLTTSEFTDAIIKEL